MFCSPYKVKDIRDTKVVTEIAKILMDGEVQATISCGPGPDGQYCMIVKTPIQVAYIYSGDIFQTGDGVVVICGSEHRR